MSPATNTHVVISRETLTAVDGLNRRLRAARIRDTARKPYRRANPKIGRNDPCPCGSGDKYKRCHMPGGA